MHRFLRVQRQQKGLGFKGLSHDLLLFSPWHATVWWIPVSLFYTKNLVVFKLTIQTFKLKFLLNLLFMFSIGWKVLLLSFFYLDKLPFHSFFVKYCTLPWTSWLWSIVSKICWSSITFCLIKLIIILETLNYISNFTLNLAW